MIYIYAVVEGQTEEKFIKDILNPYLEDYGKFIYPIIVKTKTGHKGGITEYKPIKKDILSLLKDRNVYVTTMIDYYGLPSDFPACKPAQRQYISKGKLFGIRVPQRYQS